MAQFPTGMAVLDHYAVRGNRMGTGQGAGMTVNLTDFINADSAENGWDLKGWWCGWVGERIDVIPLGDNRVHISPRCPCKPKHELVNGRIMVVHNAFDGREKFAAA